MRSLRLTYSTSIILAALESGLRYGFDIVDGTGLPGGTVYPALRRLEEAGLVTAEWEDARSAQERRRPTRRFYALNDAGRETLATARRRFAALDRLDFSVLGGNES